MNKRWAVLGLYALVILSLVVGITASPRARDSALALPSLPKVGVINVEGAIVGGRSLDFFGATTGADRLLTDLRKAAEDPDIRAVVVRMNTPGGSAAASEELGQEIRNLRDRGKPVVVSMADMAASGGYWVACYADRIVASPGSMTGSIGVIFQHANLSELYEKLGIEFETITSGAFKDMGSSDRPLTDDERRIMQAMLDDIFDQFVAVVAEGRDMSTEEVLEVADGRIFTGRQALELGLVDQLGSYHDALDLAAELAGLVDYQVKDLQIRSPFDFLLGPWGLEGLRSLLFHHSRAVPGVGGGGP